MIPLMVRQKQMPGKLKAVVLFILLFALAQSLAVAYVSTAEVVDSNEIIVNNVWVDVPLTQVFRDISMETGIVIAIGPQVPDVLVSLDAGLGKPFQQCLQELIAGQGLFIHQRSKKFYLITSGDPVSPGFMEVASSKRLYLKYITAKHLRASLPRSMQQYVSSGERPNEVLIYAVPKIMKHIMGITAKLDISRRQVVLEVLVVDLWEDASDEFGFNWEFVDHDSSVAMSGIGSFTGMASFTSISASKLTELTMTLKALISKKKASIRSRPRVATLNGEKASIDISLDEYFAIVTDIYGTTARLRTDLQIIKSGVLLEMTPQIGDNGDITVDVHIVVSDVASRRNNTTSNSNATNENLPVIRRREANTHVRVKEGDAIVIGGLIETQETTDNKRVPILSSIPLVGGLFKTKSDTTTKKEVVIFIIPRLIKEDEIVVSNRHQLIDEVEEIEDLRNVITATDVRYKHKQNVQAKKKEAQFLNEAVDLLEGYERSDRLSHETSNTGPAYSNQVDHERKVLQEVIALLDVKNQYLRLSIPVVETNGENESSWRK